MLIHAFRHKTDSAAGTFFLQIFTIFTFKRLIIEIRDKFLCMINKHEKSS